MRILAQQHGVSDVYLARVCRILRIPLTGLGYWAKKNAGKPTRNVRHCLRFLAKGRSRSRTESSHGRSNGFPHAIKLRHVYRERQAAWKLLRQFFQRVVAASEKRDFRAAIRQSESPSIALSPTKRRSQ